MKKLVLLFLLCFISGLYAEADIPKEKKSITPEILAEREQYAFPVTTAGGRAWRSAVLPGWGQMYGGEPVKGKTFLGLAFLGIAGYSGSQANYNYYKKQYNLNQNAYILLPSLLQPTNTGGSLLAFLTVTVSSGNKKKMDQAASGMDRAVGLFAFIWLYSIVDAAWLMPSSAGSVAIRPDIQPFNRFGEQRAAIAFDLLF